MPHPPDPRRSPTVTTAAAMNITREEAAARAAALTVDAYEVSLDLSLIHI